MVVGELLVAMPDPKLIQPSYEPAGAVKQVELVLFAAIDVEGFQPAKIVRLAFDCGDGILPRPVRPALRDQLAGVDRNRQPIPPIPPPPGIGGLSFFVSVRPTAPPALLFRVRSCAHELAS
jgi:hypothetical protein